MRSLALGRRYTPESVKTTVRAILSASGFVDSTAGAAGPLGVVLERTPFYAESGGQVADSGELAGPSGAIFTVQDTKVRPSCCPWFLMWRLGRFCRMAVLLFRFMCICLASLLWLSICGQLAC